MHRSHFWFLTLQIALSEEQSRRYSCETRKERWE